MKKGASHFVGVYSVYSYSSEKKLFFRVLAEGMQGTFGMVIVCVSMYVCYALVCKGEAQEGTVA